MNGPVLLIVYAVIILLFYVVIFVQRGERKRFQTSVKTQDWITFAAIIFGGVAFSQVIMDSDIEIPTDWMVIGLSAFFVILLVYNLIRKKRTGKPMVQMMGDERMSLIYAKSSRNALFTTYAVLFINGIMNDTAGLDTTWLMIMLGSGIVVLIGSIYLYTFIKS